MDFEDQTYEAIIAQIQQKARSYVPEWSFSREDPDIGTALALVYGQMLSGSVKKLKDIPYKNKIAFFQALEAGPLPAVPAAGYVSFLLAEGETQGEEVAAGTRVLAPADHTREEALAYETLDDIYVTPARPDLLLQVSGRQDFIGASGLDALEDAGVFLFACQTENLQKHRLYFSHDDALSLAREGRIAVSFWFRQEPAAQEWIQMLADRGLAEFSYSSRDGYRPFPSIESRENELVFVLGKNDAPFARRIEEGKESFWICCEIKNLEAAAGFRFDHMLLTSGCSRRAFDCIYADGAQVKREEFFPFGETFTDYSEVYFLSEDVFQKKGAVITIAFNLDFAKIPLDYEDTGIQWEWIMRRSDFKPDPEFDITIEEVSWEYFNGYGWAALPAGDASGSLFSLKHGVIGRYEKISFVCPHDLSPILIGADEGRFIRARIRKVNNLYKQRGNYISPVMDKVHLTYDYKDRPVSPQLMFTENNRKRQPFGSQDELQHPFFGNADDDALYLGFDQPPVNGPMKLLLVFSRHLEADGRTLYWEYAAGHKAWRELELVDETENMSRTGIVTMMGSRDFERREQFGFDRYWIRIRSVSEQAADSESSAQFPCLCGFYMNTVRIRQMDAQQTEYFHMEIYQENMDFRLLQGRITACRLWVDETGSLTREELRQLKKARRLSAEYREDGQLERAWVEWTQTEDFLNSKSRDRHYLLDKKEGVIRFGSGRAGRIPPASRTDNIRVTYQTGGGEHTNVPAGAVSQLDRDMGRIQSVFNPIGLAGGSDAESLNSALRRNAALLRHQNAAVTERDYEEIALDASRSLKRVKCFGGYDDRGFKKSGAVTLVLLPKDLDNVQARFYDVKAEVENYLKDKVYTNLPQRGALYLILPQFVEICVRIEAAVEGFDDVFRVKKQMLKRLEQFLDPLSGGFDRAGWEIGTLPNSLQVRNAVSDIPGVKYIKNVYMSGFIGENTDRTETDLEAVRKQKYLLPVNGSHEIAVRIK